MERVGVEEGQTPGADALSTYLKQEERKLKATVCLGVCLCMHVPCVRVRASACM